MSTGNACRLGWRTARSCVRAVREIGMRHQSSGSRRDSAFGARDSSSKQYVVAANFPAKVQPVDAAGLQRLLSASKHTCHLLLVPAADVALATLTGSFASRDMGQALEASRISLGPVGTLLLLPEETPMLMKVDGGEPRIMKRGPRGLQTVKVGRVAVFHCLDSDGLN